MENIDVDAVTDRLERRRLMEGCCDHGNEHSGYLNAGNCLTG